LLIIHADVNRVLTHARDGNITQLAEYLAGLVRQLQGGGARIAAVSAVTPHVCIDELIRMSPLTLVNLVEGAACEIRRRGLKRVALFGTRFTLADMIEPKPGEIDSIPETYLQLVNQGRIRAAIPDADTDCAHALGARPRGGFRRHRAVARLQRGQHRFPAHRLRQSAS
jgi:aspartate racemase